MVKTINKLRLKMFLRLPLFIILSAQMTFGRVPITKCDSESDCPEGHSCQEKICKKCLSCEILLRKGNSCVTDFNNCGDCLTGYEEVLITDFSTAIKPCKPLKKKVKLEKCTNDSSCSQNNYCSKNSCIKCFDCSSVNRLPPTENCARNFNGCGSCMSGFYEVVVLAELNSKPCEKNGFVIFEIPDFYKLSFSSIASAIFLIAIFACIILTFIIKKFRGINLKKTTCHPPVCPSAPPLYAMDIPQNIKKIERKDCPVTCVKVEKQQAKVFKQPDALYYFVENGDELNDLLLRNNTANTSWTTTTNENSGDIDCSARILAHIYPGLDINDSFNNSTNEEQNQIDVGESFSQNVNSVEFDVIDALEVGMTTSERGNPLIQSQTPDQGEAQGNSTV